MNLGAADIPARLALLPVNVAGKHITLDVLTGQELPTQVALLRASAPLPNDSARWETAPLRELVDEAMERFHDRRTQADAWLAPRLHATLRLSRREAADRELWCFLGLAVAPDYVIWRHRPSAQRSEGMPGAAQASRFTGPQDTQAFARLWWAAELFRNGPDYRPVEVACANQDMLNTALRLDVIDHRPTALALVQILETLVESGASRLGDRVNALCTAINTAGSTLMYEALAPDEEPDDKALLAWIEDAEDAPAVPWDRLPDGPDDGAAPKSSIAKLAELFEGLREQAPLRDRKPQRGEDEEPGD